MTKSNTIPKTVALHKILSLIFTGISIGIFLGLFRILIFSPLYLYQIDSKLLYFIIAASTLALAQLTIDKHSILRGSGVPQVRSFITQKRIVKPIHNGSLKFTFIVLLNSLGFSIGSAGPSVFIGVCAGKLVTGKRRQMETNSLLLAALVWLLFLVRLYRDSCFHWKNSA